MVADNLLARVQNLDGNNMTVRQQVKSLLASVRMKEELLARQREISSSEDFKPLQDDETPEFGNEEAPNSVAYGAGLDVESIEIVANHKDFQSLLNEKLREESSQKTTSNNDHKDKVVQKRPFLKKGEGLARFRMKPRVVESQSKTEDKSQNYQNLSKNVQVSSVRESRSAPLVAFEQLEQKLDDSSFCSTSSMIAKLMEDSIKSTPIKNIEFVESSREESSFDKCNLFGADRGMLGIIDEEPSVCDTDDGEEGLKTLLQTRLLELEAEIGFFKTESANLTRLRSDYEKEYNKFCEERMALLEKIRTDHLSGVKELEEERGRLQHEKRAFEKHIREVRNRPTKEEKEEMRLLKEEIQLLKEEMNRKESRWAAAQARVRTEIKLLKDHNSALQAEVKELRTTSKKKVMFAPVLKKSKSFSDTNDTLLSADDRANLAHSFRFNSSLDVPPTSDSGIFCDTFRSSSGSCDSVADNPRSSSVEKEKYDTSDEISTSELSSKSSSVLEISASTDCSGNREKVYADGRKEVWYPNGSVKKISSDGKITKTIFYNGDVEEVNADENSVNYYHASSQTWHSKFGDGLEIKKFPDGQVEKYYRDGSAEIISPDGTVFTRSSFGDKKWILKDGTVVTVNEKKQEKRILFSNGQIEVHVPEFKRREYPDGTIKTIYNASGMQETKYSNGRIRLKDHSGTLISDTMTR